MEKAFEMMASHFSLPLHRPGLFKDGPPQLPPSLLYPVGSNDPLMHVNMLLHHFLLKTAALNHQQHVKSLTSPYSMRGYDLFKSGFSNPASVLYHNPSTLHRPQNQAPQCSITSSLLTPPLSERSSSSVESSNEGVSSPTLGKSAILDLRKPTAKETSLKRKTPNKEVANPSKKKRENSKQNLKQTRKLSVTEQSPISGILIRKVTKSHNSTPDVKCSSELCGDIDSMYNVVDKSEESKRKLRSIKNVIGDYICRLCDTKYASVYDLAEHRCPSIIYIEYKCPECSKVFNCPANLASHRRWHKPKPATDSQPNGSKHREKTTTKQIVIAAPQRLPSSGRITPHDD